MNRTTLMQLTSLSNLFTDKQNLLKQTIGNLPLNAIKDDARFKATIARIKTDILLSPVTIGEPKIKSNRQETKKVSPNYQQMWGGQQTVNIITVEFPYTGSSELFKYRGSGGSLILDYIYLPSGSASIYIDIELEALNKEVALTAASKEIANTINLININNPQVESWSATQSVLIEQMAEQKRKELIELYS